MNSLIRALSLLALLAAARPEKPNVLLILTDDLGWQDVACYDIDKKGPFETPHIDALARQGIQFWQGYSPAPTCAPTRVAILSGKHPARSQKTHVVGGAPPAPFKPNSVMISPWYSGRMRLSEVTIAEALKGNGYRTGAVGKWHCAINHNAFPGASDQGFDYSRMNIGATKRMPNRLADFATAAEGDPFRLDENGFPFHQNSEDALTFLREQADSPFFLYYATWLVHTPIHTRNQALLRKYCKKLNLPYPKKPQGWTTPGQTNPYYAAMVETLDYHVGRVIQTLREQDDPRWPGHKLIENTYIIFTSDNGGMERVPGEIITDNAPLDKGKINAKEGGVRVPLIIAGPGIPAGKSSQTMVNGLDFYPTILGWTQTPASVPLDGLDLAPVLADPTQDLGRDTMVWHFPNSVAMQSTIRKGNFKLIRNWQSYLMPNRPALELYQLYKGNDERVDIEEAKNLASAMPEKAQALDALLGEHLAEMKASQPFLNPTCAAKLFGKDRVPTAVEHGREGRRVWLRFAENGAKVVRGQVIYTDNGGQKYEEWYRLPGALKGKVVSAELPAGASHYVFNLVDENHFLVSVPTVKHDADKSAPYSATALAAGD